MDYQEFLNSKHVVALADGITVQDSDIHPSLFPFQRDMTRWALRKGRSAIFADTGLGKTRIQLEWARLLGQKTLIIAPLSVARQTIREGKKIDIEVKLVRSQDDVDSDICITNYEMIKHFDAGAFGAVALDESSLLKALSGKTRKLLTEMFADTQYRLCCTATPAPNDYVELGNHAHFLGICTQAEMLAMFFVNANKEHTFVYGGRAYHRKGSNKGGQEWRLKHHAEEAFFSWLASWSVTLTKPSDLGYSDDVFVLPPLNVYPTFVPVEYTPDDRLFFTHMRGIKDQAAIRRKTMPARLEELEALVDGSEEQWIIWCGLNEESTAVTKALTDAIEVKGNNSPEYKAQTFEEFQDGKHRILVTKSKIGGFGMNFQNAHKMVFFGLSHSWESWYQAIRRQWRYMQEYPVDVYVIIADIEAEIYQNIMRKDAMAARLRSEMVKRLKGYEKGELGMTVPLKDDYTEDTVRGEGWLAMLGDSCTRLKELGKDSVDMSVYSPPFADLFTYTASEHDLGNSRNWDEFFEHYKFIIQEVLRVTKPGRLTCVHTSDIPAMANKDGYIGIRDFPGAVIEAYQDEGWTFVGRILIGKNPQAQAIRVKSKALLFVQMRKDSTSSRPALVDHVLLFKKPGDNAVPVTPVDNGEMNNELWIKWAHGIWTDIQETNTLQFNPARGAGDEKHICPLQLETIERCIKLYSNPGEVVLTPFGGIGSEGYQAVRFKRKAILIELKRSYFDVLIKNMRKIEMESRTLDLFSVSGIKVPEGGMTSAAVAS